MTEILRAFWKEKRPERIAVLVSGILFAVIFWIYEIPVEIAGYAFLLVILWNVIWFTLVFIRYEKRQRILEENQGKIRTEAGGFPEAESRESEMYQELIRQLYEEKKELESSVQIEKQELSDYYSMWVHQIKTPIAALGVLIQSGEELEEVQESPKAQELTRSMKMEVFRIEQYVDMVLTYLRMGSATSDYAFRICSLEEIVRQAVRKYSQMFIMTRTRLHLEIQDQKILTDEKWLTFVIEQILSNAVKYARGGEISIYTEDKILVIADDGIGIAEEDLPRIFEKGFTGYNGRANKKSTGIGLYLCKSIIDRLHHTIWIESKPEKYQEPIAQGGSNVSGGQKQRLSIARAIAIDPEILVFDDSFSALDFKTDSVLRAELAKKTQDKTVIIVAQRINTILNADQIIVLEDGKVVGKGTHEELIKNNETYKQIALSQLSAEELNIQESNVEEKLERALVLHLKNLRL